jgi:hypothetical protein
MAARINADPVVLRFAALECNDQVARQALMSAGVDFDQITSVVGIMDPAAEDARLEQLEEESSNRHSASLAQTPDQTRRLVHQAQAQAQAQAQTQAQTRAQTQSQTRATPSSSIDLSVDDSFEEDDFVGLVVTDAIGATRSGRTHRNRAAPY